MTQNLADFAKRRASLKHANGQRVAELVGTAVRCIDFGPPKCVTLYTGGNATRLVASPGYSPFKASRRVFIAHLLAMAGRANEAN